MVSADIETAKHPTDPTVRLLTYMIAACVILPLLIYGNFAWDTWQESQRVADERIGRALDVLHEHTLKVFQTAELLIFAAGALTDSLTDAQIVAQKDQLQAALSHMTALPGAGQSVSVTDSQGHVLISDATDPAAGNFDILDRDAFQALTKDNSGTYIGALTASIPGGKPVYTLARRRTPANGSGGILFVTLDPTNLVRFSANLDDLGDYFALIRNDGAFISRYPVAVAPEEHAAAIAPDSLLKANPDRGLYTAHSKIDGRVRRVGYRKVEAYPVYVFAGADMDEVRRDWLAQIGAHLIYGIPVTGLLIVTLVFARGRVRRLLHEKAHLIAVEDRLRQAQKMEAVGQLTGGVAHDFNNLLTVVLGGLDAIGRQLPKFDDSDAKARIVRATNMALQAVERAVALTSSLLAFSRQQTLTPKALDPNKLVAGICELLQRTLGEAVVLETVLAAGLWHVFADANQLESTLLNLALNARDAMPDGGKMTIETANCYLDEAYVSTLIEPVTPGQFVLIAVSDTGKGMDRATLNKAFEPFFTTKEVGKGTGLGLSQVQGFIKQSGGHVKVYSEVGEGTTVKIYLPRSVGTGVEAPAKLITEAAGAKGDETILLVEDDEALRAYAAELLCELGYRVLEAGTGAAAMQLLRDHSRIDLLFTDVIIPGGMNGRQLADAAGRECPGLKVLFTTGYTRNAIIHHGRLDAGIHLIPKPFSFQELAAKVRSRLDGPV